MVTEKSGGQIRFFKRGRGFADLQIKYESQFWVKAETITTFCVCVKKIKE